MALLALLTVRSGSGFPGGKGLGVALIEGPGVKAVQLLAENRLHFINPPLQLAAQPDVRQVPALLLAALQNLPEAPAQENMEAVLTLHDAAELAGGQ